MRRLVLSCLLLTLVLLACCRPAGAAGGGPPYITDDPEPVEYHHWEVYAASQQFRDVLGWAGTAPHVEVNYGAAPRTQLHIIAPLAFSKPTGEAMQYGFGDVELGIKYRFVEETKTRPQIGTFPLLEVPTGDSNRGLGNGVTQMFLPIWLQKSWGTWTTYGGGGYWRNPGTDNRDFWFLGWLLQRNVTKQLAIGGELFRTTPSTTDGRSRTALNLGFVYDFDDGHHLLFSAGDDLRGLGRGMMYIAYQWTFGPHAPAGTPDNHASAAAAPSRSEGGRSSRGGRESRGYSSASARDVRAGDV